MANSLKIYGQSKGYDISDEYYNDIVWIGLIGTSTYNTLSTVKKTAINQALQDEFAVPLGGGTKGVYPISNPDGTCK
ncbi:MAG: hypothetical protein COA67_11840 [Lutibacter sp.]|nr:MAG: hypothetical protein COA67_11840 [Lutibacter sp.]